MEDIKFEIASICEDEVFMKGYFEANGNGCDMDEFMIRMINIRGYIKDNYPGAFGITMEWDAVIDSVPYEDDSDFATVNGFKIGFYRPATVDEINEHNRNEIDTEIWALERRIIDTESSISFTNSHLVKLREELEAKKKGLV